MNTSGLNWHEYFVSSRQRLAHRRSIRDIVFVELQTRLVVYRTVLHTFCRQYFTLLPALHFSPCTKRVCLLESSLATIQVYGQVPCCHTSALSITQASVG